MELKIGATIKKLRTERGITQEELANRMGVSFQAVSKWETNATTPDIAILPQLALFFGVSIDTLFSMNRDDYIERISKMIRDEYSIAPENFLWAERYGLKILIDLHSAPYSQNGFDNGGISGVCKFFQMPEEIEFVYTVLERLAKRYGTREGLWGIEVLNEPVSKEMFKTMGIQERYKPVEPELAKGSDGYDPEQLREFYMTAHDKIRKHLPEDKVIVLHDGFDFTAWKDFMQEEKYKNVVLDTHQYLMVAEMQGCSQELSAYEKFIEDNFAKPIEEMQNYFPVICGEWCLFNSLACGRDTKGGQSELNGAMEQIKTKVSDEEKVIIYKALDKAQKKAWAKGSGYFYWSYKLLIDTVSTDSWVGWDAWDLGRCVDFGWFEREK